MRKILKLLGAITLCGTASTSVIACDNGKNTNSKKTDSEVTNDIKTALEETGVDGSSLDNTQKQNTANDLIKEAIKKITDADQVAEATFTFDNGDIILTAGDNTVNIKVTFNTSSNVEVAVKLTGVAVHKKTDSEVTNDIKTALEETGVDGSSLDNTQKQNTANDLIKEAIKKITDADQVAEATFTFDNGDIILTAGDNTVNIKVTFNTSSNVEVAVKLTGVAVHKKTDSEVTNDIKTALEETGVDGSSLDNTQKQNTANDLIKEAIKKITDADQVAEATFTFDNGDIILTAGDNTVNIKVTFNTSSNVEVAVKLTGVAVHKKTDSEVTNDIKTALEETGVDGSSLDNTQKQNTANDLIKEAIKKITDADQVAEATFTFDNGDIILTAGDNTVNIKVTFNTSSNVEVAVKLTGVAVHKKTDSEVTNDIKTALEETGVDGSSLDNTQKQNTANDLIKEAIKKITDADQVAEATFTFDNGDIILTAGDNTVNIKVTFNTSSNVEVAVKLTGVAVHKKTDLNTITQLTGLHLVADSSKIFKDFDKQILQADQFKNKSKINLNIIYYKSQNWKNKKNVNDKQEVGKYFVKIEVITNKQNIDWKGVTNYLPLEVFLS